MKLPSPLLILCGAALLTTTAKAQIAILVTIELPAGVDSFAQIDGVWVCGDEGLECELDSQRFDPS